MSSAKSTSTQSCFPNIIQACAFDKGLDGIESLLSMPRTKKKTPNSSQETIMKCKNIILGQMITGDSTDDSVALLRLIGKVVYEFAKSVYENFKVNSNFLKDFIDQNKACQGKHLFTVSSTTLRRISDDFPVQDANNLLDAQVATISKRLAKQGLKPPYQLLAIDPSDVLYRGKFSNQWTPYAYTGQQTQYKRAFKENVLYSDPLQMICGVLPSPIKGKKSPHSSLSLWIQQVKNQISLSNSLRCPSKLILGDREFYSGIGNAFSYLGLWDESRPPSQNPRMVVPKKIWKNASAKKWAYLLDTGSKIIEQDSIELDYYDQPFLGDSLSRLPQNPKGTRFYVPLAKVAVFDNYTNKHERKTIDWAYIEANKVNEQLRILKIELKDSEIAYLQFLRKNKRDSIKKPSYGKKKRSVFQDYDEKVLYNECFRIYNQIKRWKKRKEKLLKRLMFFSVSLHENEEIEQVEEELVSCADIYHQRWGVEIGIKLVKYEFPVSTNSRKPTKRHLSWIMSSMVQNSWHFYRLTRAARKIKDIYPKWKPYNEQNPLIRKKWEREFRPILTARAYIMELMRKSLNLCMKKALNEIR